MLPVTVADEAPSSVTVPEPMAAVLPGPAKIEGHARSVRRHAVGISSHAHIRIGTRGNRVVRPAIVADDPLSTIMLPWDMLTVLALPVRSKARPEFATFTVELSPVTLTEVMPVSVSKGCPPKPLPVPSCRFSVAETML